MAFARSCKGDTVAYLMLICVTGVSEDRRADTTQPTLPSSTYSLGVGK